MLDKFMEKVIESATSAYLPRVEEKAKARKEELEEMKLKVRTNPEQVEEWFDKEIDKLQNIDIKEIMKNATAGI
jgi:3-methyladenine DNA glycosylase AlkD